MPVTRKQQIEARDQALAQAGFHGGLSPEMQRIALETAREFYDEFADDWDESERGIDTDLPVLDYHPEDYRLAA